MLRFMFIITLLAASVLISGAQRSSVKLTIIQKDEIKAAGLLVSGVPGEKEKWQKSAADNPLYFIELEAGIL